MTTGLLRVRGTLDLDQFWPYGTADADTTKLVLDVRAPDAFTFRERPCAPFRVTRVFDDAIVVGRTTKPCIDDRGRVVVRLQGADAPELHYTAAVPRGFSTTGVEGEPPLTPRRAEHRRRLRGPFRQPLAETATLALVKLLADSKERRVRCVVTSAVARPGDVFDTYGRLVGDVQLRIGRRTVQLNRWLVERGWAVPAFYDSMSAAEIRGLRAAAAEARRHGRGIWRYVALERGRFEPLPFRDGEDYLALREPERGLDRGEVVLPKLFRRLATYAALERAGLVRGGLAEFLRNRADRCVETEPALAAKEGRAAAAPRRWLHEFVGRGGGLRVGPEGLVFLEAEARVVVDGREAAAWWRPIVGRSAAREAA